MGPISFFSRLGLAWIAGLIFVWFLNRTSLFRRGWGYFTAATDKMPFFASANPPTRLGGIAFGIALLGFILGVVGSLGASPPFIIVGTAGFLIVVFGVSLGFYSIASGWVSALDSLKDFLEKRK